MIRRAAVLVLALVAVLAGAPGATADSDAQVSVSWQPYGEGREMRCTVTAYPDMSAMTCDPDVTRPAPVDA